MSRTLNPLAMLLAAPLVFGCANAPADDADEGPGTAGATHWLDHGSAKPKIIGGSPEPGMPAVGMLMMFNQAFCTATVIAPQWVLSAGHCFEHGTEGIAFGIGPSQNQVEDSVEVDRVVTHPQFALQGGTWRGISGVPTHDISLAHLSRAVQVTPYGLNTSLDTGTSHNSLLVGYGVTNGPAQSGAGTKRRTEVAFEKYDEQRMEYANRGTSACNGDSGGPAFLMDASGTPVVGGVTSWGDQNCAQFGVYTRVDHYVDWIRQTVGADLGAAPAGGADPGADPAADPGGAPGGGLPIPQPGGAGAEPDPGAGADADPGADPNGGWPPPPPNGDNGDNGGNGAGGPAGDNGAGGPAGGPAGGQGLCVADLNQDGACDCWFDGSTLYCDGSAWFDSFCEDVDGDGWCD